MKTTAGAVIFQHKKNKPCNKCKNENGKKDNNATMRKNKCDSLTIPMTPKQFNHLNHFLVIKHL